MVAKNLNVRRRGFTLIELLVVIAIVVILAGLIGAGLQRGRQASDSAHCISNLRQWAAALSLYIADNDGFTPRRGQGVQPLFQINRPTDWFNALPQYLGLAQYQTDVANNQMPQARQNSVWICPSATNPGGAYFLPYGMNMYLSPWIRPLPHRLVEIPNPELLAFMADAPGQYSSTVPSALGYSVMPRHNGRANVSFLDGHVASFEGSYLGCGVGEQPNLPDIRWQTLSTGVNQAPVP